MFQKRCNESYTFTIASNKISSTSTGSQIPSETLIDSFVLARIMIHTIGLKAKEMT